MEWATGNRLTLNGPSWTLSLSCRMWSWACCKTRPSWSWRFARPMVSAVPYSAVFTFDDIVKIGQDQVDSVQIAVGKHDTDVDHDHIVPVFKDGHVLANFPQASQGNNA